MGACPDWYAHIQAARYLRIDPQRLAEMPLAWKNWALAAMDEEAEAQKSVDAHNALKGR